MDVSVTVNIMISGPDGLTLSSTSPRPVIVGNSRAYVSTAHIASFGRDHSGWYMCEAKNVKRTSQFLTDSETITERKHVTVGKADTMAVNVWTLTILSSILMYQQESTSC